MTFEECLKRGRIKEFSQGISVSPGQIASALIHTDISKVNIL